MECPYTSGRLLAATHQRLGWAVPNRRPTIIDKIRLDHATDAGAGTSEWAWLVCFTNRTNAYKVSVVIVQTVTMRY